MAQIILDPGEIFEHIHPAPSTTALVAGEMSFTMNGETRPMIKDEVILVPANTVHRVMNTGLVQAIGFCGHKLTA